MLVMSFSCFISQLSNLFFSRSSGFMLFFIWLNCYFTIDRRNKWRLVCGFLSFIKSLSKKWGWGMVIGISVLTAKHQKIFLNRNYSKCFRNWLTWYHCKRDCFIEILNYLKIIFMNFIIDFRKKSFAYISKLKLFKFKSYCW